MYTCELEDSSQAILYAHVPQSHDSSQNFPQKSIKTQSPQFEPFSNLKTGICGFFEKWSMTAVQWWNIGIVFY